MAARAWVGIDTGGTFTDVALLILPDAPQRAVFFPQRAVFFYEKVASSKRDPARAILDGVGRALARAQCEWPDLARFDHGTTLATNALLEGKLPRTGMITTAGFRDVIEIARQRRPHMFNLRVAKPDPIARREHRVEVLERVSERGEVLQSLDEAGLEEAGRALLGAGCEAVAICFLHAYANAEHEQRALQQMRRLGPHIFACGSHEVVNELREYERFCSTVVNASLMPVMASYVSKLESGLIEHKVGAPLRIMQSSGGAAPPASIKQKPVNTFFSGPAAGVIASAAIAREAGIEHVITFDMGGTSSDICLIRNAEPSMRQEREIAGLPVRVRSLDIHTLGAGGGSIAWLDQSGLLKVGPQSAGAHPGPAAYARGGELPTVTDANVVLNRLPAELRLGGQFNCSYDAAAKAIDSIARPLGLSREAAALGVLSIVNTNMAGGLKVVSIERGFDPRDAVLLAFGGAGPLHAGEVAAELDMRRVLIPRRPGVLSALGLLQAHARNDFSRSVMLAVEASSLGALRAAGEGLLSQGEAWLRSEALERDSATWQWFYEVRYRGQSFEITVRHDPPPQVADDGAAWLEGLSRSFHARHAEINGFSAPDQPVEVVTLRLAVVLSRGEDSSESISQSISEGLASEPTTVPLDTQVEVWFDPQRPVPTRLLARDAITARGTLAGPAIVSQMDATILIPPAYVASEDKAGNLIIERDVSIGESV